MARNVTLPIDLWDVDEPGDLTPHDHLVLLLLATARELDAAGRSIVVARRWAGRINSTEDAVRRSLAALDRAGRVLLDDEHDEVLLLDFMAWQFTGASSRRVVHTWDVIARIESPTIAVRAAAILTAETERADGAAKPITGLRLEVFSRDGWRCRLCSWRPGDPTPRTAAGRPLHRCLEVDHIHPRAHGGTDDVDNLQTLCSSCNARKGSRVGVPG